MSILNQENVIYQCVLICESFKNKYASISTDLNCCLLSLLNRPLLDYTLNALKISGIHEVHLFCSTATNEVRSFIKNHWSDREKSSMSIVIHSSDSYLSLGDILRDIFTKAIIRSDFILLYGDTICNINLADLIEEHKSKKAKDKGIIMTLVMRLSKPNHRTRRKENESAIVVSADTNRLLFYDKVKIKKVNIKMSIFQESKVRIHFDLQDTQISICTSLVAQLFADNFDYQTRDDLIHGVLDHEEILNNSIYVKVIKDNSYAARAYNPAAYDSVCKDMIQRWTFPVVPDIENNYCYQRHHIYKQDSTSLTADSKLEQNVVLSKNTIIGDKIYLKNCVIEADCEIGNEVYIINSYILNGSKIEDDCHLNGSIIGRNVNIKKQTRIEKGCLISNNVIIGPEVTLSPHTFIESKPLKDKILDVNLVGKEGKGYEWVKLDDESEEESPLDYWEVESDEIEESEANISSFEDDSSEDGNQSENFDDDVKLFFNEVIESLQRGIEDRIKCENLILEVNSSKHAYNIPINDVTSIVIRAIMIIITRSKRCDDNKSISVKVEDVVNQFLPLIKNYIKTQNSQKDCLLSLEEFTLSNINTTSMNLLTKMISFLYEKEILEEDVILNWYESPSTISSLLFDIEYDIKDQTFLRQQKSILTFVQWLKEAEEESDELKN